MIHYLINPTDCNTFELDMIENANIEGVLMPTSVEKKRDGKILIQYADPINKKRLIELINDDYYDLGRFHDFLTKIIALKIRLETYMLSPQNIIFNSDNIWYDPIRCDYQVIYLPQNVIDPDQELNLYRHIFIESSKIIESNITLLKELKQRTFDLEDFCILLQKTDAIRKDNKFWRRLLGTKQHNYCIPESKTIQKTRKSCLLDVNDPTLCHEFHFNHIVLGRGDDCNIQIDDPSISRRHAIISKNKHEFSIEDLDSSNGTHLNGQIVKGATKLVNGDKIQFGDKEFIFIQ